MIPSAIIPVVGSSMLPAKSFAGSAFFSLTLCGVLLSSAGALTAQITVDTHTGQIKNEGTGKTVETVDRRYQQIKPTNVTLSKTILDPKTKLDVMRVMQAEQGFAMRPFPKGHKGLTLVANGKLEPAGEAYVEMVTSQGICANPGDRLVLTDVKVDRNKIIFDIDGGPDARHRFLRHIQLGTGPNMTPVTQGNDQEPLGARLTLVFPDHVPELTGPEIKALLAPLISFDVKTPVQAFTDTLPTKLKDAILNHHVLVGMSTDMVLFSKGQPESKSREMEGQMPFEEWIYGKPPQAVEFVRINGNRVIRLEVAKMGEVPEIFTKDEVEGLLRTDGTALEPSTERVAEVGDVRRDPNRQEAAAPPSLRNPGETLPADDKTNNPGQMKPVHFPKPKPNPPADSTQAAGADQTSAKPADKTQIGANPDGGADSPTTPPAPSATDPQSTKPSAPMRVLPLMSGTR